MKVQQDNNGFFKAYIPLKKGEDGKIAIFTKKVGDKTVKFLRGEATNTKVDKADERVNKSFILKMKDSILGVNVFAEHEHHLEKTLGFIEGVGNESEDSLILDTALEDADDNELVKKIVNKIEHGTKLFYSIAGKVTKAVKKFDKGAGKVIKDLLDGEIYEVSITALPEGNVDFLRPIMKSMNDFLEEYGHNDGIDDEELQKTLTEMVASKEVDRKIWDLFYAFRESIYKITNDNDLKPKDKKNKIMKLAKEYASGIENLSSELAKLTETIENELTVVTT